MELMDRELKDRKEKIKREIEELLHKPIKDDMDKFEEQEMKKMRPVIRKWFGRLINTSVIQKKPEMIRRDKLKDKIIRDISRLFETKKEERKNVKHNCRINKDRKIRDIRTLFEKENEERKKKKELNERLIKDGIIRERYQNTF